jgi:T4 RnlA family RNA ligase
MNEFHQNLYDNLMTLVSKNEAFFFKDFGHEGSTYRIFNYRMASYTDFLEPSAIECRGVMFEIDGERDVEAIRLASLPMEKFFNLNENPSTMNLDLSSVKNVELKADGSLISTYVHNDQIRLKSKGSLESDQAIAAMKFLDKHPKFAEELYLVASLGNTVNLEWCAPDNRIVISYMEPQLTVLNIRNNDSGKYVSPNVLMSRAAPTFKEIIDRWISQLVLHIEPAEFVAAIPDMEGIEGYVVELDSGQRVKIKTEWYLTQHRAKDSINSPRRLFEACIEEATDDLRSLFYDDPLIIARIDEMQKFAESLYNGTVAQVEKFYERNKDLERKDYAILGQKELDRSIFGLAMNKYLGREVDYKHFLRKNYKSFGVADDPEDVVE